MVTQKVTSMSTGNAASKPKRSTTKAAAKKPVAAAKASTTPKPVGKDVEPAAELSKKELLERLVQESGLKKSDARLALNSMLTVLHGALSEGKGISAAPLGKIKIARKKETPNGELVVLRVKLRDPSHAPKPKPGKAPVADVS